MNNMIECPRCHYHFEYMLTCQRCGHKWIPRSNELPTVCPNLKCKSPYWNKPRTRGIAKAVVKEVRKVKR